MSFPELENGPYRARFFGRIEEVPRQTWNARVPHAYPFLSYAFLQALESSQSVGRSAGMLPMHLELLRNGESVGFVPLYLKFHSYGEYIFDWEWARGAQAAGIEYYPKLLVGAPYTPAVGPRFLMAREHIGEAGGFLRQFCLRHQLSGAHVLHCLPEESAALAGAGFVGRETHQYHFHNQGYGDFEAFLASLKSRHRKQIKKERERAADNSVTVALVRGTELSADDWAQVYRLYEDTYRRKWGSPYLTPQFFSRMPTEVQETVLLVTARDEAEKIQAVSIAFESETHLYGRYWGCATAYDAIHFEFCYYRFIEYAIKTGKKVFEAGAQGEHKIKRGFVPVAIHSAHVFSDERLQQAVSHFCQSETTQEEKLRNFLNQMAPFRAAENP